MSGVAICHYMVAVVPAARIVPGVVRQGTALPAIGITQVSGVSRKTLAGSEAAKLVTERVQVTVLATSYRQQKDILALVRAALPPTRGQINGFACDSIEDDIEGPDLYNPDPEFYEQGQDFFIRFTR